MVSFVLSEKPSATGKVLRKRAAGWHKRSCAALLGATTLMSISLSGPASTPAAAQQQQKPNILSGLLPRPTNLRCPESERCRS
jgi:arylsulfatase